MQSSHIQWLGAGAACFLLLVNGACNRDPIGTGCDLAAFEASLVSDTAQYPPSDGVWLAPPLLDVLQTAPADSMISVLFLLGSITQLAFATIIEERGGYVTYVFGTMHAITVQIAVGQLQGLILERPETFVYASGGRVPVPRRAEACQRTTRPRFLPPTHHTRPVNPPKPPDKNPTTQHHTHHPHLKWPKAPKEPPDYRRSAVRFERARA
jgi:hypothetical protein